MLKIMSGEADCLLRLNAQLPNLHGKEQAIADYVVKNAGSVLALTIYELAEVVGVSPASLTRFTKRMGYRGFNDFKIALAHAIGTREPDPFSEELEKGSPDSIIQWVFEQNVITLRNTLKVVSRPNLIRAAELCLRAPKAHFYGVGSSGLIAQDAAIRFSVLGLETGSYSDPYLQLGSAVGLKEDDVAVAISHTGASRPVIESLRVAKESGAHTICITNYSNAPLIKIADIPLLTSSHERRIHVAALTSQNAQLAIVDSLYFLMAQQLKDKALGAVSRLEDYVIELLRED